MAKPKKGKARKVFKGVRFFLVSFLLVCVMCASICGVALALYLRVYIEPNAKIDVNELMFDMDMTSIVYAWDPEKEDYTEYEVLRGRENRIWSDLDEIPKDLQNAFIAIEDKRFYEHKGVDWKRTANGVINWIVGKEGGGSTITQQLIKNLTDDKDYSVKRKLNEIFRALQLEKDLGDKNRILEMYLNLIYLGQGAYGVNTAATTYFSKDLDELNLAECAILAGITKNPSRYDPFNHPETIKERQETILNEMCKQGMISESERDEAKAQPLEYKYEAAKEARENTYSYFTDAVINDVINDLVEKKDYPLELAKWKVTSGGVQIYTTVEPAVQSAMEEVYEDDSNFPNISRNGMRPESAMVICNDQGDVVGIVGGRGKKTDNRVLVRADSPRQAGSSIKPLSAYGPAMDAGLITPYSVRDNAPFKEIDGRAWPRNDSGGYTGPMTIRSAVAKSTNAIAVRVVDELTPQAAYDFLTEQLDFKHLNSADIDLAPMALGGMNGGVTVREMAAGFSIFLNDGIFNGARTYTKVLNSDGTVLLENEPLERQVFEREQTVYYMRDVLKGVTSSAMGGTARRINVPGMDVGGKTGTSQKKRDLWFCGFTPYYAGATWFGYDSSYDLSGVSGNPSLTIWNKVMNKVHENLEPAEFDMGDSDNFEKQSYCTVSGLAPSSACRANGTVETGRYWKGDAPSKVCTECSYVAPEPEPEPEEPGAVDPENPGAGEAGGTTAPTDPSGGTLPQTQDPEDD
ncbi:MAG: transglycosylase domain-containing protein [Butyricicoccus pullicaecorum]|nr:transglycosylase domain-containing protein [Butyricicoccus pullicaecorum]